MNAQPGDPADGAVERPKQNRPAAPPRTEHRPPPVGMATMAAIAAFAMLISAVAVLLFVGAALWIVEEWTLLRLMTTVIGSIGLLFLGAAGGVAAAWITAKARQAATKREMEQSLGDAAAGLADGIGNAFASTNSAGRLAIGGCAHLWVAGALAAVDFINRTA